MKPRIFMLSILAVLIGMVWAMKRAAARDWIVPSTQPSAQADPGAAIIPKPSSIAKITSARPTRVMFEYNPTPIYATNPRFIKGSSEPDKNGEYAWNRTGDSAEYMLKLGFEPSIMVYNGTLNRSQLWYDKAKDDFRYDLKPALNRLILDWTLEANHCDPVTPEAARACAMLSRNPWAFGAKLAPYRALVLDVEGTKTYNSNPAGVDDAMHTIAAWTDMFKEFRKTAGGTELYSYFPVGFYPDWRDKWSMTAEQGAAMKAADAAMMRQLSGVVVSSYNFDPSVENPGLWFATVDQAAGVIDEYYPWLKHNKWAVITPTYAMYWPTHIQDQANLKKADQPVDLAMWQRQVKYLVDRGWHLYVWVPQYLKVSRPYLDFVAKYAN